MCSTASSDLELHIIKSLETCKPLRLWGGVELPLHPASQPPPSLPPSDCACRVCKPRLTGATGWGEAFVAGLVCADAPVASVGTKRGWLERMSVEAAQAGLGRTASVAASLDWKSKAPTAISLPAAPCPYLRVPVGVTTSLGVTEP